MKRHVVLFAILTLFVLATTACRSKTQPKPATVPPAITEATPAERVPSPDRDFQPAKSNDDMLSDDMAEANRQARERGWILDAFFSYDAAALDNDAQSALQKSATWLRTRNDLRLLVEGHCDERGTEQYNLALGDRRAETAASFLETLGVERSRIDTVSYGEDRPFEPGSDEDAWAQNRRAHLVLARRR